MSMDYANSPFYNGYGLPLSPNGMNPSFGAQQQFQQQIPQQTPQQMQAALAALETPTIVCSGKRFFSVVKEGSDEKSTMIPVDGDIPDTELEKRKRGSGRPRKETGSSTSIVRANSNEVQKVQGAIVEDMPTSYTYMETNGLLHETLSQIDGLNVELMREFEAIRHNRTMKNKHNVMIGLSENIGSLINNRISVIKEINSTISKSNDMDYKKEKDRRVAASVQDDDKYIADLYKSFMQNPVNVPTVPQVPQVDPAIFGSGVVRADLRSGDYTSGGIADVSYLNYMSNLTPE